MVKFSAYWPVENNPKRSANNNGHIRGLKKKTLDLLFCASKLNIVKKEIVCQPPAASYVKQFTLEPCHLKFGIKISPDVMTELSRIWCSKILLFKQINDDAIWLDCVTANNVEKVKLNNKICVNKYSGKKTKPMYRDPFHLGDTPFKRFNLHISAQVIGIPNCIISEVNEMYIEQLKWVNDNYPVYDEEVVLTHMYHAHPNIFEIIN